MTETIVKSVIYGEWVNKSDSLVSRKRLGQRLCHSDICPAENPPLIDRSYEYAAFISGTGAEAIYGNICRANMLTDLWQDKCHLKFYCIVIVLNCIYTFI